VTSITRPHAIPHAGNITVKLKQDTSDEVCPGVWRAWPIYPGCGTNGPNILRELTITDETEARRVVEERLAGKSDGVVFFILPPGTRPAHAPKDAPTPAFKEPRTLDLGWLPRGRRRARP
jgi:hypothetical protein